MTNSSADGNEERTVWPADELTRSTKNAIVAGELVALHPDRRTIVIEAVESGEKTLTVDLSACPVREWIFENEPEFVHLFGVETLAYGMFLRAHGTKNMTASTFELVGHGRELTAVPDTESTPPFEVLVS